jgi:hypothetical protein
MFAAIPIVKIVRIACLLISVPDASAKVLLHHLNHLLNAYARLLNNLSVKVLRLPNHRMNLAAPMIKSISIERLREVARLAVIKNA